MLQASKESIDRMKALYAERGKTITDYEANDAVNNLCEYFKILNEWDLKQKAKEQAATAEGG